MAACRAEQQQVRGHLLSHPYHRGGMRQGSGLWCPVGGQGVCRGQSEEGVSLERMSHPRTLESPTCRCQESLVHGWPSAALSAWGRRYRCPWRHPAPCAPPSSHSEAAAAARMKPPHRCSCRQRNHSRLDGPPLHGHQSACLPPRQQHPGARLQMPLPLPDVQAQPPQPLRGAGSARFRGCAAGALQGAAAPPRCSCGGTGVHPHLGLLDALPAGAALTLPPPHCLHCALPDCCRCCFCRRPAVHPQLCSRASCLCWPYQRSAVPPQLC
mmetsp:Transcript_2941/g.7687  ORF Transcript_2941/g.7687 Transcript_2941/m.7687 type:complete len:269 (-) Transcript_2941:3302-4108(-)